MVLLGLIAGLPDKYVDRFTKSGAAIVPTIRIFGDFLIAKKLLKLVEKRGNEYLTPEAIRQGKRLIKSVLAFEDGDFSGEERSRLLADPLYFKDMFPVKKANGLIS